jgi:hypothetical protein
MSFDAPMGLLCLLELSRVGGQLKTAFLIVLFGRVRFINYYFTFSRVSTMNWLGCDAQDGGATIKSRAAQPIELFVP